MVDRFTDRQIQFLSILPSITAPFSVIGSSIVLYMIWNSKTTTRTTTTRTTTTTQRRLYHRLVTAICISDIISSASYMFGPLPVRDDIDGVSVAHGNQATCTLSGFMFHLRFSNAFYNMSLMVTFLLMVRYEFREDDIAQRYERYMHILAIGYPLITGIVGLLLEVFNPVKGQAFLRCYIAAYPPDCDRMDNDVKCSRGSMARPLLLVAGLLPMLVTVCVLFTSTFLVWWTVRQNDRRTRRTSQYNVQNTSREVGVQSMIYGIFFFNTYIWLMINPIIDIILDSDDDSKIRIIARILGDIFYPTQGVWTLLIFIRPRYVRIRTVCTERSRFWALKESIVGEKLEYYNARSLQQRRSNTHHQQQASSILRSGGSCSGSAVAFEKTSGGVVRSTSSSNLDPLYNTPEGPISPSLPPSQQQQIQEDQDDTHPTITSTIDMDGVCTNER